MFKTPSFFLGNFEGPLELLLFLIQNDEMDLYDISLKVLTNQVIELIEKEGMDSTAEALSLASMLLVMKSQKLLPQDPLNQDDPNEEKPLEMIQKLIEYCRFRDTAILLSEKEEKQQSFFVRPEPSLRKELGSGLEEVQFDDLKKLLLEALAKSEKKPIKLIQKEIWQVETKIAWFQQVLPLHQKITFEETFSPDKCKEELISTFLALLELMKQQFLKVARENETLYIMFYDTRT